MTGYRRKQTTNLSPNEKKLLKRVLLLLLVMSIMILLFLPGRGVFSYIQEKHKLKKLEEQKESIIAQNEAYRAEIEKIKNDDSYIEQVAREEYGLQKPNETIFHFKREEKRVKK